MGNFTQTYVIFNRHDRKPGIIHIICHNANSLQEG